MVLAEMFSSLAASAGLPACDGTAPTSSARQGVRKRDKKEIFEEAADVLAWLSTICSLSGVDLEEAALAKYGKGCPRCAAIPCSCP